jgi:hypothetical protein
LPSPAPKPSVQDSDTGAPEPSPSIALTAPRGDEPKLAAWTLTAWNRRVLKDWEALCRDTPEDAVRCHAWLSADAVKRYPGRCFELKGHVHLGNWCYEIGSGNRVYYKVLQETKSAVIWYAGAHPKGRIPAPPRGL